MRMSYGKLRNGNGLIMSESVDGPVRFTAACVDVFDLRERPSDRYFGELEENFRNI